MKNRKKKVKKYLTNAMLLCCVAVFLFSTWKLVGYLTEYKKGEEIYLDLSQHVTVPALQKDKTGEKSMERPEVDWDALSNMNEDIVAWLYIDGTSVQYPVVKGTDNEYYLTHTSDKKKNSCGSIFMDMDNEGNFTSQNTILYGHNMKTGKMFGSLKFYRDADYWEAHPDIFVITRDCICQYKIFTAYETVASGDVYQLGFSSEDSFKEYIDMCKNNSIYDTGVKTGKAERLLTLSTCTSHTEEGRFIVQALLVSEKEIENES